MTLKGALSIGRKELAQLLQSLTACPSYKTQEAGDREVASGTLAEMHGDKGSGLSR